MYLLQIIIVFILCCSMNCLLLGQVDYDELNNIRELTEEYERTDIIFSGIVFKTEFFEVKSGRLFTKDTSDTPNIILKRVYFIVTEVFKGIENLSIAEVVTNAERQYYGYPFEQDKEYIVYGKYQSRYVYNYITTPEGKKKYTSPSVPIFVYTSSSQRTKAYDRAEAIKLRRLAERRYRYNLPDE